MTTNAATATGRLEYQWNTVIDYASLEFDPDEPEPLPDAMQQDPILRDFLQVLADRCTEGDHSPDNFLSSNTILCYNRANLNVRVQPDCYLAFGVDVQAIRRRKLYLPWEVGKPPDLALEVGSESTSENDIGRKREIYAQIGIPEYWRFDPTGGELYGEPLAGEMLAEGVYRPVELTTEPDGVLKGYSPILGMYLCWNDGELRFYDLATRTYFRNLREERTARELEEAAHEQTRAALQAERAEREAAEARIRRLEEQLGRQQPEN